MLKFYKTIFFIGLFLSPLFSLAVSQECVIVNIDGKTDEELKMLADQCEREVQEQKALLDKNKRVCYHRKRHRYY